MAIIPSALDSGVGGGTGGAFANPFSRAYNREAAKGFVSRAENERLTRYFGMRQEQAAIDPYTTGYGHVIFELPNIVDNNGAAGLFLTGNAKSITVPSYTLNVIEYEGLNSMSWGVPGNATIDSKTFTVRMEEKVDAPIMQLIGRWITMLRDINYGVANLRDYTQSAYKGNVLYASTDPTGRYVMSAFLFTGVFPTRVPFDTLSLDVATQDRVEPDFEFHFDMMYVGDEVLQRAKILVDDLFNASIGKLIDFTSKAINGFGG